MCRRIGAKDGSTVKEIQWNSCAPAKRGARNLFRFNDRVAESASENCSRRREEADLRTILLEISASSRRRLRISGILRHALSSRYEAFQNPFARNGCLQWFGRN